MTGKVLVTGGAGYIGSHINKESLKIVQKFIASTHDLGMVMTAAGVEPAGQLAQLKAL
jgi:UDP-glucose 4-epimerase